MAGGGGPNGGGYPSAPNSSHDHARAAIKKLLALNTMRMGTEPRCKPGDETASLLKSSYRHDMHTVLHQPKHAARHSELEKKVIDLLDKVGTNAKANNAVGAASQTAQAPAVAKASTAATTSTGVQADLGMSESVQATIKDADNLHLELYPAPAVSRPLPSMGPHLVIKERDQGPLREQLASNRGWNKALHELDHETTTLFRKLKLCRMETWKEQLRVSDCDAKIQKELARRTGTGDAATRAEEEKLEAREKELMNQISDARAACRRWVSDAKRRDAILQQEERECHDAKSMLRLFARHPAGEIAGLPFPTDSDSDNDDDEYRHGPSHAYGRRGDHDVALASSDEDNSSSATRAPAAPHQRCRSLGLDDDDVSDASSMPSPSEGSLSLRSPSGEKPSGANVERPGVASGSGLGVAGRERRRGLDTCADGSSDEDADVGTKPATQTVPSGSVAKATAVPPLPDLANGVERGRSMQRETSPDEIVEEVYSEQDFDELDSSRSV
eukprot:TRINITY_DN21441_c0_g1_i1.p1 TRINITY_DN21441_c0_g1~~TRINITY_DN21441_c0_g1_i1.p1  ORF type:complete len:501 (+),score=73.52 TRINITY_DN21441_c0_g1_i1:113-1615(+)